MQAPDLAIALKYDREGGRPPHVVAKGRGPLAASVVAAAEKAGVAIKRDPDLAAALAALEVDEEIPLALFAAVAEIIARLLEANDRAEGAR